MSPSDNKIGLLSTLLLVFIFTACSNQSSRDFSKLDFAEDNGGITLPEGFKAVVVADSLGYSRHMAIDSDGDLYVALREPHEGNGIVALQDTDNDGKADIKKYFSRYHGTGIALHNEFLYFGSDTAIVRYSMDGVDLVPSSGPETVVNGFPVQNQHATKSITIDPDGNLFVNVGAPSNACQEQTRTPKSPGQDPCPQLEQQAGIWKYDADQTGQVHPDDGDHYASGIRNAVAIEWDDTRNQLFAVQHGRDQLNTLWPEHYDVEDNAELPAEEFFKIDDDDHFGWPYCYYDHIKGKKVLAPEYGGNGEEIGRCSEFEDPILAFPGHWGPNDLLFYTADQFPSTYRNGAFIAFHGSWNRAPLPQQGYNVVYVPFQDASPTGEYETFANGFASKDTLRSPRNATYRPTGLEQGNDGSLYITETEKGRVWKVVYTGE